MMDDKLVAFQRIRALKDIYCDVIEDGVKRKIKVASKGDLGAYIVRGALNQNDNAWAKPLMSADGKIVKDCYIGPRCRVSGNAIVEGSIILNDVVVRDYANVRFLKIKPLNNAVISENSSINLAEIQGNVNLKGNACIYQSDIFGGIEMDDDSLLYDCLLVAQSTLKMTRNQRYCHNQIEMKENTNGSVIIVTERDGKNF